MNNEVLKKEWNCLLTEEDWEREKEDADSES